ncbi:DUF7344 domain-containing protein [Haloarchaeobius sp. DT45]|uniref:DUF7344 domain-containing protein n=1 Tax=Haloarchaeobius sp. DT45 TaxID=3446116 RepID=UPI003F6C1AB0
MHGGIRGEEVQSPRDEELSRDCLLEVLSNQRRRFVIHQLKQQAGPVELRTLAEQVASWENDKPVEQLTHKERKRVMNALRQFHLPKMADSGVVEYDSRRGTVELTEAAVNSNFYVDVMPERGIPWGLYYLGLSGASVTLLAGVWFDVFPFHLLSPKVWSVFFVTLFFVSSVGHFYDNYYRMRLGAKDEPPEVKERR